MNRLEKEMQEETSLFSIDMPKVVAQYHAKVAMKYIRKAFEAGIMRGSINDAPALEQWLDEQKLQ
jgi:hypothetical protein